MKIKIDNTIEDKTIFEGEYSYSENLTENVEKPAFLISLSNQKKGDSGNYELHFSFENEAELDELIKELQFIKEQNKDNH
jgi:hypothetical protein